MTLDLPDQVVMWLTGKAPNYMQGIARRFGLTTADMAAVVKALVANGSVREGRSGRAIVYFVPDGADKPLPAPRQFKPMTPDRRMLERLESIKAERAAYPSKHI